MAINSVDSLTAAIISAPTVIGKDATTAKAAGIPHTPGTGPASSVPAPPRPAR
jgi:hypothetical protein